MQFCSIQHTTTVFSLTFPLRFHSSTTFFYFAIVVKQHTERKLNAWEKEARHQCAYCHISYWFFFCVFKVTVDVCISTALFHDLSQMSSKSFFILSKHSFTPFTCNLKRKRTGRSKCSTQCLTHALHAIFNFIFISRLRGI